MTALQQLADLATCARTLSGSWVGATPLDGVVAEDLEALAELAISGIVTANGAAIVTKQISELIVLATDAEFTESAADLLPANSEILGIVFRITTAITGVNSTALEFGDSVTSGRFGTTATLTANHTGILQAHRQGSIASDATGPIQTAAAKLRLTLSGGADDTPAGGAVRVTVNYLQYTAPTS